MIKILEATVGGLLVLLAGATAVLCSALYRAERRMVASAQELDRVVAVLAARLPSPDLGLVIGRDDAPGGRVDASARRAARRRALLRPGVPRVAMSAPAVGDGAAHG